MNSLLPPLSFINSNALVALLALAIPLLIHFIFQRKGRILYVANLDLIKSIKKKRVGLARLDQKLLLLLRLLMVLISILVIAQPLLKIEAIQPTVEQIFLSPDWLKNSDNNSITALEKQHASARWFLFSAGFPEIEPDKALSVRQQIQPGQNGAAGHFALLTQLAEKGNLADKKTIYLTNRLSNYSADFTALPGQPGDNFNLRIKTLEAPDVDKSANASPSSGKIERPLTILLLFAETKSLDAQILSAALSAIENSGLVPIEFESRSLHQFMASDDYNHSPPDWALLLRSDNYDQELWRRIESMRLKGSNILSDGAQHNSSADSKATVDFEPATASSNRTSSNRTSSNRTIEIKLADAIQVDFYRHERQFLPEVQTPIWSTAQGDVVLARQTLGLDVAKFNPAQSFLGAGTHLLFFSRFNPNSTNLVEKPEFPAILARLLAEHSHWHQSDFVDAREFSFLTASGKAQTNDPQKSLNYPLQRWLMTLLMLLWLVERIYAARLNKIAAQEALNENEEGAN